MIRVQVETSLPRPPEFAALAHGTQRRFRFVKAERGHRRESRAQRDLDSVVLYMTDAPTETLFHARVATGVAVSTWQSAGICSYAGLSVNSFVLLCTLLGLTEWRALVLNPLLRPEDMIHEISSRCLYTRLETKQDYALLFEDPRICRGCNDFYHCLGADEELVALQTSLRHVRRAMAEQRGREVG